MPSKTSVPPAPSQERSPTPLPPQPTLVPGPASPSPTSAPPPTSTPIPPTPTPAGPGFEIGAARPTAAPSWILERGSYYFGHLSEEWKSLLAQPPKPASLAIEFDANKRAARVSCQANCVPAGTKLVIASMESATAIEATAGTDGSFNLELGAVPGSHVVIKQDVTQADAVIPVNAEPWVFSPGVLRQVGYDPDPSRVVGAHRLCCTVVLGEGVPYVVDVSFSSRSGLPGAQIAVTGHMAVYASGDPGSGGDITFFLEPLADERGQQIGPASAFVTSLLNPLGLPVARRLSSEAIWQPSLGSAQLRWTRIDGGWRSDINTVLTIPSSMSSGTYIVRAHPFGLSASRFQPTRGLNFSGGGPGPSLGLLTVGVAQQVRLTSTILAEVVSDGVSEGIVAREDSGRVGISNRNVFHHSPVVPRVDAYGSTWTYSLEPYFPFLGAADRAGPAPPAVSLDFADSELVVTVQRPDGGQEMLGPAPLMDLVVQTPRAPWGGSLCAGGGCPGEFPRAVANDQTFHYRFPSDGDYVIRLEGRLRSKDGRTLTINSTHDVTVGSVLEIDAFFMPGTPFEVGDDMPVGAVLIPQVPAEITYAVSFARPNGQVSVERHQGRANTWGVWDGGGKAVRFTAPGEYRVDIEARHRTPDGRLQVGRMTSAGVVATPNSPIQLRGRRGHDSPPELYPPWAFAATFAATASGTAHWHLPYFSGDVIWADETERAPADATAIRFGVHALQQMHPLVQKALSQARARPRGYLGAPLDQAFNAGQMPLVTASAPTAAGPGYRPQDIEVWAYAYGSVQRPWVRVREFVQGDDADANYWRFNDPYHLQAGVGQEGDLPGEFKFQYGGGVLRDARSGEAIYAIYGSGWVQVHPSDKAGSRVMPPYQGAAGGPDGGPLIVAHGREVDILFVPMGVRPGSVLEVGQRFRFAGPIMPTLSSRITFALTSPDGRVHRHNGLSNAVGYFYDPAADIVLDRPGIWRVEVEIVHEGDSSAGPVAEPFPRGGPLTPDGRSFEFVVVPESGRRLEIHSDLESRDPCDLALSYLSSAVFAAKIPPEFGRPLVRVSVSMPGILLEETTAVWSGDWAVYALDGRKMNRIANNFDVDRGLADIVTVTMVAEGRGLISAGTYSLFGRVPAR